MTFTRRNSSTLPGPSGSPIIDEIRPRSSESRSLRLPRRWGPVLPRARGLLAQRLFCTACGTAWEARTGASSTANHFAVSFQPACLI